MKKNVSATSERKPKIFLSINAICAAWLRENGYDGLCDAEMECGCSIVDLMPCELPGFDRRVAAHKELQNDGDWLMFPGKSNLDING